MRRMKRPQRLALAMTMMMSNLIPTGGARAADDFWAALTGGKPDLYMRYRFETVDDDQGPAVRDAYANTLRTALGYGTGLFHGVGAYVQMEDVRTLGAEDFNDGGHNGVTARALVVDPEGTELQQANLRYRGLPRTEIKLGRQDIEHRQAPMHRYVGNILWRQNWQSFDGLRVQNDSVRALHVDYAYVWQVNRIFGEDNPLPDRSRYHLDGHLIDMTWKGLPWLTVEPYAYVLDFDSRTPATRALSTSTFGTRGQGSYDLVTWAAKLLYVGEYAHQQDNGDNPLNLHLDYYFGELGATKLINHPWVESVTVKASYEVLGGEGTTKIGATTVGRAFQTPLGTNHAFQGWADRFLTTPPDGVRDLYGTAQAKIAGATLAVMYHDFRADHGAYAYGDEWDVVLSRVFFEHYTVGLKYANYDADPNATNLARNGAKSTGKQAFDLEKFWAWVEIRF